MKNKTESQRFYEKYAINEVNGCWEWINCDWYPKFWTAEKVHMTASRYSYSREYGIKLTPAQHVCHKCDNPRCVNPDHLFLGDVFSNMGDKVAKGRSHHPIGVLNGRAKLTMDQVREIRTAYKAGSLQKELAAIYGLTQPCVSQIILEKTWKEA